MFPVMYELDFYINLLRNSVFKGLTILSCNMHPEVLRRIRCGRSTDVTIELLWRAGFSVSGL
jgi:hypothetical protein